MMVTVLADGVVFEAATLLLALVADASSDDAATSVEAISKVNPPATLIFPLVRAEDGVNECDDTDAEDELPCLDDFDEDAAAEEAAASWVCPASAPSSADCKACTSAAGRLSVRTKMSVLSSLGCAASCCTFDARDIGCAVGRPAAGDEDDRSMAI